jgi:hypothetical protein
MDPEQPQLGELRYASSDDGGDSWSAAEPLTPVFDSHLGWPQQQRLGDYFHMVSDDLGVDLAYAATIGGEQNVYYLRIGERDCNRNSVADATELDLGTAGDCNHNRIPDSCEIAAGAVFDGNGDGIPDSCTTPPRRARGRLP